ncbi:hypothetical protein [Shouchella miscanthi]|uniref:Uncharacterized protein n=1 Tax=Shouchella miscanthi TaxID=2598861 RepID=A0ABU6NRL0_9BACI|nr:hypothetical protein [Shouchella miscanthi]
MRNYGPIDTVKYPLIIKEDLEAACQSCIKDIQGVISNEIKSTERIHSSAMKLSHLIIFLNRIYDVSYSIREMTEPVLVEQEFVLSQLNDYTNLGNLEGLTLDDVKYQNYDSYLIMTEEFIKELTKKVVEPELEEMSNIIEQHYKNPPSPLMFD